MSKKEKLDCWDKDTWRKLKDEFNVSKAKKSEVKLPREKTQKAQTLMYLYKNKNSAVLKATAEAAICGAMEIPTKDIQSLRHLSKQDGFKILQGGELHNGAKLPSGQYVFCGFDDINSFWSSKRRDAEGLDFSSIKDNYGHSCATCGAKEGKEHRYTKKIVVLEKGHMDPSNKMDNSNIIPQCKHCNTVAKNHFVFNCHGRVKKMTIAGILKLYKRGELENIKKEIEDHLKK